MKEVKPRQVLTAQYIVPTIALPSPGLCHRHHYSRRHRELKAMLMPRTAIIFLDSDFSVDHFEETT